MNNLATPDDIDHALPIKDSRNAVSKYAASKYSRPCISLHILGRRQSHEVLQWMANHPSCGVFVVMPIHRGNQPEPAREGKN